MNEKTIATIALRDGEYDRLQQTLEDAARLVKMAADQGADLAVLPEDDQSVTPARRLISPPCYGA